MELEQFLTTCGYDMKLCRSRRLAGATYILAKPLLFHWTLIRGEIGDFNGYDDRHCYWSTAAAMEALDAYPFDIPDGYEPQGWHRHPATGRRREDGDPQQETFG